MNALADFLADKVKVAVLAHQHDIVLVVGNVILLGGDVSWLKQRNAKGIEIDISRWKESIEVKNGVDIGPRDVAGLVGEYFDEMVASKASKRTWWLCFFLRRPEPKGKIAVGCMYYLAIVEVRVAGLDTSKACRASIEAEAVQMSEEIVKQVVEEDGIEDGFLVPVKNVWIVDKLRMENKRKDEIIVEKDKAFAKVLSEKDKALSEKDKALAKALSEKDKERSRREALDRENAELKKRLGI